MQKYFIREDDYKNNIITGDDAFHITRVMRSNVGDKILVSNGKTTCLAEITSFLNNAVSFNILEEKAGTNEMPVFVTIFQGYPKGDKLEDVIKYGTEFGMHELYPVLMKRSVFKLDPKKKASKLERFNKIAKESAEQSYRDYVPAIPDIVNLKAIIFDSFDHKILCYEESGKNGELVNFKSILTNLKENDKIAVLVGPEGGIDDTELEFLKSKGFIPCGLGPRILRTEVAAYYALAAISYELELKK